MSEQPTPITDDAWKQRDGESSWQHSQRKRATCSDLERQLGERPTTITDYQHLLGELAEARRERNEAREQRDALAEALKKAMLSLTKGGSQ